MAGGEQGSWLYGVADPVRLGVLRGLAAVERATAAELARRCQASMPTLRRHLDALVAIGLIEQEAGESDGETPGRPAARFSLNPQLRPSVESVFQPSR
jgi:predicted ArsR family transcriptional regulator